MANENEISQEPRIYRFTNYPGFGYRVDTNEHDVSGEYVKLMDYEVLKSQLDSALASLKTVTDICIGSCESKPEETKDIVAQY